MSTGKVIGQLCINPQSITKNSDHTISFAVHNIPLADFNNFNIGQVRSFPAIAPGDQVMILFTGHLSDGYHVGTITKVKEYTIKDDQIDTLSLVVSMYESSTAVEIEPTITRIFGYKTALAVVFNGYSSWVGAMANYIQTHYSKIKHLGTEYSLITSYGINYNYNLFSIGIHEANTLVISTLALYTSITPVSETDKNAIIAIARSMIGENLL